MSYRFRIRVNFGDYIIYQKDTRPENLVVFIYYDNILGFLYGMKHVKRAQNGHNLIIQKHVVIGFSFKTKIFKILGFIE